jgi:oxygen-dependent protoporphyrinogen oxidase
VVGGGIAGLTVAYRLVKSSNGLPIDVTLFEASDALGGKVRTTEVDGLPVEAGADSFVVRKPWAVDLCKELGLGAQLVIPGATGAYVWARGRLVPFPERSAFGVPSSAGDLLRWPGLTPRARLRAALDLVRPAGRGENDESLGSLVTRRMGRPALEALVAPLLAGLHAGDPDHLSVEATFPELRRWERDHGSLIRGARAALKGGARASERTAESVRRAAAAAGGPLFTTVWDGLTRLVGALAEAIGMGRIRLGDPVSRLRRTGERFAVETGGEEYGADAVVLTTPAFESSRLVRSVNELAARELEAIRYSSSAVVALVYPPGTAGRLPERTGFVVAGDFATINACTFVSRKWPDDRYGDRAVVRCFVGRAGREDALSSADEDLADAAAGDVERAAPIGSAPSAWKVVRWDQSMPQYEVGHVARVARIRDALSRTPGLFVTGSAFDGVGIADCIRQGSEAAGAARAHLGGRHEPKPQSEREAIR